MNEFEKARLDAAVQTRRLFLAVAEAAYDSALVGVPKDRVLVGVAERTESFTQSLLRLAGGSEK